MIGSSLDFFLGLVLWGLFIAIGIASTVAPFLLAIWLAVQLGWIG